jgi:hypothetical protein
MLLKFFWQPDRTVLVDKIHDEFGEQNWIFEKCELLP